MASGSRYLGPQPLPLRAAWPQTLLILACVIALLDVTASDDTNKIVTNKNENLCLAVGGVCTARNDCGPQDAHLPAQLCRRHGFICCIQEDNNEASEKRKRETTIKKTSNQKNRRKINDKKSNTNRKGGYIKKKQNISKQKKKLQESSDSKRRKYPPKVIEKDTTHQNNKKIRKKLPNFIGVGSSPKSRKASKTKSTRQKACKAKSKCKKKEGNCQSNCSQEEEEIPKGCKSPKTCKCCVSQSCKAKKNCLKKKGFCKNKNGGCPDDHKTKSKWCQTDNCICCIPTDTKPSPKPIQECRQEDCAAENGQCVPFSDECPTGFTDSINYVLCQSSDCQCCMGPTITLTTAAVDSTGPRGPKECPKTPVGDSQTCPTCGLVNGPDIKSRVTRVTGGETVEFPNKYPWLVWLQHENMLRCGGAIISSQFVLTAAQCIYKICELLPATAIDVIIADHNRNSIDDDVSETCTVKSEALIPHPDYKACTSKLHDHDIALIKLSAPLNLNSDKVLRPICLPTSNSETYLGLSATVAGWGLTSINGDLPDLPHEVEIQVLGSSSCERFWYWSEDIMLCAGGNPAKDACIGDSGIPLIREITPGKYTVIGIVSAGDPNCKGPGVYTRVNKYLDWIRNTAELTKICPVV